MGSVITGALLGSLTDTRKSSPLPKRSGLAGQRPSEPPIPNGTQFRCHEGQAVRAKEGLVQAGIVHREDHSLTERARLWRLPSRR